MLLAHAVGAWLAVRAEVLASVDVVVPAAVLVELAELAEVAVAVVVVVEEVAEAAVVVV